MGSDTWKLRNVNEHMDILQKPTTSTTSNAFFIVGKLESVDAHEEKKYILSPIPLSFKNFSIFSNFSTHTFLYHFK